MARLVNWLRTFFLRILLLFLNLELYLVRVVNPPRATTRLFFIHWSSTPSSLFRILRYLNKCLIKRGVSSKLAIFTPMFSKAPCVMLLMQSVSITRANGGGGGGLGPSYGCCPHQKRINHRCIGGFMYKSPRGRFQGPYCGGWGSRCIKELNRPARAAQVHKEP